ncbi:MAG: zinc-binding alcohol dehydrogenase family protein, partial [Janthinobacterium lividum]
MSFNILDITMPSNTAAYVVTTPHKHIEVKEAPYTKPGADQLVIRNHAVAVNPIDWMLPMFGAFQWVKWPFILGSDSAGEVMEVGTGVTRFKPGDRVVAHAVGYEEKINTSTQSSFQLYTVVLEDMTSHIPNDLPYENASVLPLGLSTAACALFQRDQLNLQLPTLHSKATGETVLVWGGSTSVGSNAIQLAVAAGYEVLTTCSPRNFDYCKSLGAAQCFDYNSLEVKEDVIKAMSGRTIAGVLAVGNGSVDAALDILAHCHGHKFISIVSFPEPPSKLQRFVVPQTMFYFLKFLVTTTAKSKLRGIEWKFINGTTLLHNEVGKAIYADFLGQALEAGVYQCKPEP